MKFSRFLLLALFAYLICTWIGLVVAYGQEEGEEEEGIELLPPNYVSAQHGFGIVMPEGYITFEYDEDGVWVLQLIGEMDQAGARITARELPEGVLDVAGFWQYLKDQDPLMARNVTYEMVDSIADTGAVLSRVEDIQGDTYILAIGWAFVHDGYGFTLTGYPPEMGDYSLTKELALEVAQQFRWMTAEEIAEFESAEQATPPSAGREF
jgi:hypothetical protein